MAAIEVGTPAKTLALAALWLSAEASADPTSTGASYDCSNASGAVEQLVCTDSGLAALDRQLADTYATARSQPISDAQRSTLAAEQRGWIKGRNDCWKSENARACVETEYRRRIVELQAGYGLVQAGSPVYYACGKDGEELIVTSFSTDPPSVNLVRGAEVATAIQQPAGSGARYEGRFGITFWSKGAEGKLAWPQATEVPCHRTN